MRSKGPAVALLLFWLASCLLYGYAGGRVPAFLACVLTVLLAGSLTMPLVNVRRVRVERTILPAVAFAGEPIAVRLRVRFAAALPVPWLLVRERWTIASGMTGEADSSVEYRRLFFPWGAREVELTYSIVSVPRGTHAADKVEISSGDLFGFISFRRQAAATSAVTVYPKPARTSIGSVVQSAPYGEASVPAYGRYRSLVGSGLREYAPGDPMRLVHWRSSAKRGTLLTRQTEPALSGSLTIVLDCWCPPDGAGRFEAAVEAAAGLWLDAGRYDEPVGFVLCADEVQVLTVPGKRRTMHDVIRTLADLKGGAGQLKQGLRVAAAMSGPGSRLIVVTARHGELLTDALLAAVPRRRSAVSAVVCLDQAEQERSWEQRLRAYGVELTCVGTERSGRGMPYAAEAGA